MDSIFNNKPSHSNWPSPSPVTGEGGSDISIKKINALKGQYTILNILLYGIKISVIDALEFQEAYEETIRLRESCEILLIRNADVKSSVILRSLFRPKFTVAFGKIDVCTSKYTNLFLCCLTDDTECFVFRIGPKRNVIFDSRE